MVVNPVLFMTFARPEYARPSWEAIKKAQPKVLYFYSNKGRTEKEGECARNEEIRSYIKEIDWECDLHTWFRDEYVDVYTSLLGAKQWAFKNEETLIMLEEDCLASQAFFEYCDHFLQLYRDEKKIGFITGNNYTGGFEPKGADHFITRSIHHFGWATWKDRWDTYDYNLNPYSIINAGYIEKYFEDDYLLGKYYKYLHKEVAPFVLKTGCWDYLKVLNQFRDKTYAVTPIYNLVQNVGLFGTHTDHGKGAAFELSNNEKKGGYPFNGRKIPIIPNSEYDFIESKNEGLRKKYPLFIKILRIKTKELFPNIYNALKVVYSKFISLK